MKSHNETMRASFPTNCNAIAEGIVASLDSHEKLHVTTKKGNKHLMLDADATDCKSIFHLLTTSYTLEACKKLYDSQQIDMAHRILENMLTDIKEHKQ